MTAEFYLHTWNLIKDDWAKVANAVLQRRRVAASHTKGVMVLIPKCATPSPS